jgi:hypothetical protein
MVNHLLETSHPLSSSALRLSVSVADLSSILRTLFQVPYPVSPLSATLTKTPGGVGVFFPFRNPLFDCRRARADRRFKTLRPSGVQSCSCPPVTASVSRASQVQSGCWPPLCFFKVTDGHAPKQDHSVSRVPVSFPKQGISSFYSTREKRRMAPGRSGHSWSEFR